MSRYLKAMVGDKGDFLVVITDSTDVVERAREVHKTSPVASAAIGRTLTAVKLMSLFLKDDGARLSLVVDGDGDLGKIISFADFTGHLKAKVNNPHVDTYINENGKLDVGRAVGSSGYIRVMMDGDKIKPFTGQSEIVSGEIAEDIANYYLVSEQKPTAVSLGVFVNEDGSIQSAGGFILQVLPGAREEDIDKVEECIMHMETFSQYMSETRNLREILDRIFHGMDVKVLDEGEYSYSCDCSRDRASRAIDALSVDERNEIVKEHGFIEVNCDYCTESYKFSVKG